MTTPETFSVELPVISLDHVSFAYNGTHVLEDVTLTVADREAVCVVGPNGGGKTTLLKLILGLLRPDSGKVRVLGHSPDDARRQIGYMPQHGRFDPLFPVTVKDIILMGRLGQRWGGPYSPADKERALAALGEVGLTGLDNRPFAELSGGQRQRVLIARALACEPRILLLDEPMANVDPQAEAQLFDILAQLGRRMTLLMVTHDLGFTSQFFQRVVCVNRRVVVHPTSKITGEIIQDIYGGDLQMVRHDHTCSDKGHTHV